MPQYRWCVFVLESTSLLFALQDALSSFCIFPASALESATSLKDTGSFSWRMMLETKIWAREDQAILYAPVHSSHLQPPTTEHVDH